MVTNDCLCCGKNFIVPDNNPGDYEIMYCSVFCKEKDIIAHKYKKEEINNRFDILDIRDKED